jgi:hypothetical protein
MLLPSSSIYSIWEKKRDHTIISPDILCTTLPKEEKMENFMLGLQKQTQHFMGVKVKLQGEYLL